MLPGRIYKASLELKAVVRDHGAGFSQKALQYADREFYSGDESRHDRRHQGLGLAIAKRAAAEQGGFLEYGNRDTEGAEVALWVKTEQETDA
ncbi:MAG: ATP-binding protein [Eubacteriales bacterium]|nr:ATP-binding protein [Eubacteriales bacterium]